jgi:pimeloyl-ACP methyl ester carboxylesterase
MPLIVTLIGILIGIVLALIIVPLFMKPTPAGKVLDPHKLADADSQFIELNGITVHYKKYGSGKPTLILVHGFGSNLNSWKKVLPVLAERYTVIAYDWIGFGLTTRPMPETWTGKNPYGTSGQVEILIGLMDALSVEKAVIIGHSVGALIAGEAALLHPQRINPLILVGPVLKAKKQSAMMKWLMRTPQMDRIGPLLSRQILNRDDEVIRSAWHDPSMITKEIHEDYHKPLQIRGWDYGLWEFAKAEKVNVLAKVGQFKLPVLIISGSDDHIVPARNSIELYRWIPGAEMAVIENAGHIPQEEKPAEFISVVQAFINKITK